MVQAPLLVSVVIPNYNYAAYVGAAIDSALQLDWPRVEVIVVDDGSSDGSRPIIEGYGSRIEAVFQQNQGQAAACNQGFARSRGEVVIFLDSDDLLDRMLIRELAAVWRPGISKVQFQMRVIDAEGHPTGSMLPHYHAVPTPAQIRRWATTAAAYPTPPGSGNAYARAFLEKVFPLDSSEDKTADSPCLAAAPFLGDVVTIAKPLVSYRVHGQNHGAMASMDAHRFGAEVARARWRFRYAQRMAASVGIAVNDSAANRSMSALPYRLSSLRLDPERHPIAHDTVAKVLRDTVRASFVPQGLGPRARAALLLWTSLVASTPQPLSARLILWRFAPSTRPRVLRRALRWLVPEKARASVAKSE
jgi:glycosyltransferase involved in cell wall biosynthesis